MGLIIEKIKLKGNEVYLNNTPSRLLRVLSNNNFLSRIHLNNSSNYESTYISYESFNVSEKDKFERYLIDELSGFLKDAGFEYDLKSLVRVISEMFINVKMHTKSREVMTCGYYLPEKKMLYFSISNHGITIRKNIELKNRYIFNTDIEAINWAVKKNSSTRIPDEVGGLGLYTSREFVNKYNGAFYIASGRGYWKEENGAINASEMHSAFPGTIITFKIQLMDKSQNSNIVSKQVISIDELLGGGLWNV